MVGAPARANGCGIPYDLGTNTYSISLPLHFTLLASCTPTATFNLNADVDLTGITVARRTNFTGTFDGNGYTISNLAVSGTGLFDVGSAGATFTRVRFVASSVQGSSTNGWAGALVRQADGPVTITNSSFQGTVTGGSDNSWAGGFIGEARENLTITDSYMKGTVVGGLNGNSGAGGFVGNVNGFGVANKTMSFLRNYMTGSITGGPGSNTWAGGFFGNYSFFGSSSTTRIIENSFVRANAVSGPGSGAYANGFIGDATVGEFTLRKSYFQGSLSAFPGNPSAAVLSSGTVNASSMFCVSSCITSGSGVGTATASLDVLKSSVVSGSWDFTNTWCYSYGHNDGYPVLKGLTFGPNAAWGTCATAPVPPAPETTTTTSTTTSTTSTTIACQVASVQSGDATRLQPGQSLVVRDGSVVKSGVFGSATVSNRLVRVRERGIASGASVDVWLVKGRHYLGTLTADSAGAVQGRVELPQGVEAGVNTLQLVERNCNTVGNVMSLGLDLLTVATLPGTGNKTSSLTWTMGLLALMIGVVLRRKRIS